MSGYVYTAVRRKVLQAVYGEKLPPLNFTDVESDPANPLDPLAPEAEQTDVLEIDAVNSAVEGLRPRWGEVLRRRFFDGATRDEIASLMGVSYERVRVIEAVAIRSLRRRLGVDQAP